MTATEPTSTLEEQIAVLEQAGYPDLAALCKTLRFGTRAVALLRRAQNMVPTSPYGRDVLADVDALLKEIDG